MLVYDVKRYYFRRITLYSSKITIEMNVKIKEKGQRKCNDCIHKENLFLTICTTVEINFIVHHTNTGVFHQAIILYFYRGNLMARQIFRKCAGLFISMRLEYYEIRQKSYFSLDLGSTVKMTVSAKKTVFYRVIVRFYWITVYRSKTMEQTWCFPQLKMASCLVALFFDRILCNDAQNVENQNVKLLAEIRELNFVCNVTAHISSVYHLI